MRHNLTNPSVEKPACRFCHAPLRLTFVDLGLSPLCETYIPAERLHKPEKFFPLRVYVCSECLLVQLEEYVSPEDIFGEYAYFSSYSDSWVAHAKHYCFSMMDRFGVGPDSLVMEIASNDGYLLQHFRKAGIRVLGIEPARNVAQVAIENGIATEVAFFGSRVAEELAERHGQPDLLVANNVFAHVPDINDFTAGIAKLLKSGGVVTLEFPHLLKLMEFRQFDTIYHEHFSYFSFATARRVLDAHGLTVFDVQELPTHGGSLRIYARHNGATKLEIQSRVAELESLEASFGLDSLESYLNFSGLVSETKRALLDFLISAKREGKTIVGYGAPGKGNTLLNYCGIRTDFLEYTVDRNPYKQGKFTPGTRIPIYAPEKIAETKPDLLLVLPWNLREEIIAGTQYIREWGGRWIIPIPMVEVVD